MKLHYPENDGFQNSIIDDTIYDQDIIATTEANGTIVEQEVIERVKALQSARIIKLFSTVFLRLRGFLRMSGTS